ncbi:MAG: cell wall metabolism sensor histidine kinase WalK [Clostridiales bacterium]|nr:cell wall metabolism sensor histidine kinase WalK [Clostridiales bacterium]
MSADKTANKKLPSDHRRIAWRLSGRIAGGQIAAFILIDAILLFMIAISWADEAALRTVFNEDLNIIAAVEWLRSIRYLDIGSLWALVTIGVVQILLVIGQAVESRKYIRELLEPLRELRVAADAFAGAAAEAGGVRGANVSSEALRRMAEALSQVEAGDMNPHIAAEAVSPELRPLLAEITDMLDRLEGAYAAQTKFVSDASHELRTPIAVIQGYANLLSRWGSEDPETLKESIEAIRSEAESMKRLVNQLLFLARGDSDTLALNFERIDLVDIAGEVLREALMLEEGHGEGDAEGASGSHEIEARLPESGVYVSADPALVKQLVRILVDNSLKYTPSGGGIMLSVSAEPDTVRALVVVQDEGEGIPAEALPHIFDRFVRVDEARTRNAGGAGLGLSIARQIAERHGGSLEVYSIEGAGSRFTAALPLIS